MVIVLAASQSDSVAVSSCRVVWYEVPVVEIPSCDDELVCLSSLTPSLLESMMIHTDWCYCYERWPEAEYPYVLCPFLRLSVIRLCQSPLSFSGLNCNGDELTVTICINVDELFLLLYCTRCYCSYCHCVCECLCILRLYRFTVSQHSFDSV